MKSKRGGSHAHAEVGAHRALVGAAHCIDQDVVQLDIPVHDGVRLQVLQRARDVPAEPRGPRLAEDGLAGPPRCGEERVTLAQKLARTRILKHLHSLERVQGGSRRGAKVSGGTPRYPLSEKGVRSDQTMRVGSCIPVGVQL